MAIRGWSNVESNVVDIDLPFTGYYCWCLWSGLNKRNMSYVLDVLIYGLFAVAKSMHLFALEPLNAEGK